MGKKKRRRRLPNGFGRITELKGQNLRCPFRAMVTVGKDEFGKPIGQLLKPKAYFATYNEAYEALLEHHKNPYIADTSITFAQLYEKWSNEKFKTVTPSSVRTISCAYAKCEMLYDIPLDRIRPGQIKDCINACQSPHIKSRIKSICNLMFDYALEYGYAEKNYARMFEVSCDEVTSHAKSHMIFSDKEMQILWEHKDDYYVRMILIQCYTGFRPAELCELKNENINLEQRYIVGGGKTKAGTDRIVPIHSKIYDLISELASRKDYLFSCDDTVRTSKKMTYDKYRHRFDRVVKDLHLDPEHSPHDGRKHFITLCKKYNVDEYAIKRIVGHEISDLTERVYTERSVEWLLSEVNKIEI